jgi:thiol-disulfide isomerase/thioredoxin
MEYLQKARSYLSWKLLMILVTIVLLICAIAWVYKKYLVPQMNPKYVPNKEFTDQKLPTNEAELIIFTVDWCPYCKKAMPVWKEFEEKYNNKVINGYSLIFRTIDCTDEKDADVKEMLNKYNIEGYPTIKMIKDGETVSYDAKPELDSLEQFLQTVLTQ